MDDFVGLLSNTLNLTFGKISIPVPYWQAAAIIALIFFLILLLAKFREHSIHWSLKGGVFGIFFGFLLALILEGFLLIGGKTVLTEALSWENPPKPIAHILDAGRSQLINVLGVKTEIPTSYAKEEVSVQNAMETIQSLNPTDLTKVKNILCSP